MNSDCFIAIYTHSCKKYCDDEFFNNLKNSSIGDASIMIVDNSLDINYLDRLKSITDFPVVHIDIERTDPNMVFHKNVIESVDFLRSKFLATDCKYFIILEADVCPPDRWIQDFKAVINKADIIGGIYYYGFHRPELWENEIFEYVNHALSGCTLYKRHIIEEFPFRWDPSNLAAFPDAFICYDVRHSGKNYKIANYSKIKCRHLTKKESDSRGVEDIE